MAMRVLLALLVVAASASPAFALKIRRAAEQEPLASCDVQPGTWPRNGATYVPRNAHAWVFAGTQGNYELVQGDKREPVPGTVHEPFHMIELALPHLDANTLYTIVYADREITSFTTGAADDVTPPDPPVYVSATVSPGAGTPVSVTSEAAGRQGVLKLTIQTEQRSTPLFIPASSLQQFGADCAGVQLRSDQVVCFDLAELDVAANRSAATRYCTTVASHWHDRGYQEEPPRHEPGPNLALLVSLLGIALLTGIGIVKLNAQAARDARQRHSFAPVEIALVRPLARAQRIRAVVVLVVCVIAIPLTGLTDINLAFVLATPLVGCVIVAAAKAQRLHRVLMDLDAHNASVTYDGDTYLFTQQHHWIAILPGQLERVIAASFPTAKIR